MVAVYADGEAEHWCCAYDEGGQRRFALMDSPAACRERYGDRGGAWTEGVECLPCCCRVPVSETDAARGARYELTSPVACAGVGECLPGDAPDCETPPDGDHPKARRGHR